MTGLKPLRNGFIAVASTLLLLVSFGQRLALAHANLESSMPAANSVVSESPGEVRVRFTEPVEPNLTLLQVLNTAGQPVDNGDTRVSESDRTVASVTVGQLDDGTYTVAWHNVSAVDGHPVRGSFIFSVGFPTISGPLPRAEPPPVLASNADPWARWGAIAGVLGLFGGLVFRLVFELTVARKLDPARETLDGGVAADLDRARRRSDVAIWGMLVLAIAGSIAHVAVVTATTYQIELGRVASGDVVRLVQDTFWGQVWLARVSLLVAAAILLALVHRPRWPWAAALLFSGGAVVTMALVSHGAAAGEIGRLALITDLLHAFAAAIWIGGLLQLAILLTVIVRSQSESIRSGLLSALVPNFSLLAGLSGGVLLVTGIFEGYAQVTAVEAATTPYGYALLAKLAVILPLAGLAAINLLRISPWLATHEGSRNSLARAIWVEVGLGALVFLAVAFMTAMEPARQTRSRELSSASGIEFEDRADGAHVITSLQPGTVGDNSVVVHLNDRAGRPIENASSVSARMRYLGQDLGESLELGLDHGDGIWVIHSVPVPIAGPWRLEVLVQRPDAFDANLAWGVDVDSVASQRGGLKPVPATARLLFGAQIALIGLLAAGVAVIVGGWGSIRGKILSVTGVVAAIAGAFLILRSGALFQDGGLPQVNPVPRDQASVDAGRRTYVADCQSCHGESGTGNGPARVGLPAAPSDLTIHVPLHGDGELFRFIHDGFNTMPAFGQKLSDEDIWNVVNYLRTLTTVTDR